MPRQYPVAPGSSPYSVTTFHDLGNPAGHVCPHCSPYVSIHHRHACGGPVGLHHVSVRGRPGSHAGGPGNLPSGAGRLAGKPGAKRPCPGAVRALRVKHGPGRVWNFIPDRASGFRAYLRAPAGHPGTITGGCVVCAADRNSHGHLYGPAARPVVEPPFPHPIPGRYLPAHFPHWHFAHSVLWSDPWLATHIWPWRSGGSWLVDNRPAD